MSTQLNACSQAINQVRRLAGSGEVTTQRTANVRRWPKTSPFASPKVLGRPRPSPSPSAMNTFLISKLTEVLPATLSAHAAATIGEHGSATFCEDDGKGPGPVAAWFSLAQLAGGGRERRRGHSSSAASPMSADRGIGTGASRAAQGPRERPIIAGSIGHGRSTRVQRSWPPTMTFARRHAGGRSASSRRLAASHANPMASVARPTGVACRSLRKGSAPPKWAVSAMKRTARSSARSEKRCRHERTVRPPVPSDRGPWHHRGRAPTGSSTAAPTAKVLSSLRRRTKSGKRASPTLHARHQARRDEYLVHDARLAERADGTSHQRPSGCRSQSSRAVAPAHSGRGARMSRRRPGRTT